MDRALKEELDRLAACYNEPGFVAGDPVQFPRRYTDPRDIEISAFLTSIISWGRRQMILSNAGKLHNMLYDRPYEFVADGDISSIGEGNIHRTFFGRHLRYVLRGLREVYARYGSLEGFAVAIGAPEAAAPAWELARRLNEIFAATAVRAGERLDGATRCLPDKVDTSALKRLNMALRWLVRNDGIVDMGIWTALKPSQLFIPLDVHSAATGRSLGLLTRKQNDRKAVEELTACLRRFNPNDPTVYDFALFGYGVNNK